MKRIFITETDADKLIQHESYAINMTGAEIMNGTEICICGMTISFRDNGTVLDFKYGYQNYSHTYKVICGIQLDADTVYIVQWSYDEFQEERVDIFGGSLIARITNI